MAADRQTHLGLIHDLVADHEDGAARSVFVNRRRNVMTP